MHILERFLLHFFCSTFAVLAIFIFIRWILRRRPRLAKFISPEWCHLLFLSAVLVGFFGLREAWDLYRGNNSFVKSVFDQISWLAGALVSAWGLYRFRGKP